MSAETVQQRYYELDWLRVMAIIILLFYHVGMIFVSWEWHIKNSTRTEALEGVMSWLHQWRMPLLLFVSGAGTRFALGVRTPGQYVKERSLRLLIPLVFGIFVIVPPQIYFERIANYASYWDFYRTTFEFIPYPKGNFSWHHLWFIAYLFVYSLITLPLLLFLRKSGAKRFFDRLSALVTRRGGLLLPIIPIAICYLALKPFFPEETHALVDDWAFFVFYLSFFLFGYILSSDSRCWQAIKEQKGLNLIAAVISLVCFFLLIAIAEARENPSNYLIGTLRTFKIAVAWTWVIAIVGYGRHYLCFSHPALRYANDAIYPFYILHQTVIIVIGYYVIKWSGNLWIKFGIVSLATFIVCMSIYELLIKRFNATRLVFGMKPEPSSQKKIATETQRVFN